jgi:flagellin
VSFSIETNISGLQAQENLRVSFDFQSKTIGRVTSGLRILSSGDDAAGLAIANGFRSDRAVLTQGIRNANDGLSQLQIIDGGINNISKLLDRARTLATQSASGTFTGSRSVLNSEFQSVLSEIDRQSQAIGLNTGGEFARSLSVFIGGGKTSGGVSQIDNGSVGVDLSSSTVDARSLGLSGLQAAGVSGTDISSSSATSVSNIVASGANTGSTATAGFTDFFFRGPGFADGEKIKVSVNLAGVTDTQTLVTNINAAIESAGNQATQQATAFKNAGVKAIVVQDKQADGTVKERVGFTSSTTAFQVQAGDRLSNALLGTFSAAGSVVGDQVKTSFVGGTSALASGATAATAQSRILVRFQGGGLEGPVDVALNVTGGTTTVEQVLADLSSQVTNNATLQAAGISVGNLTAGERTAFENTRGERFEVLTAGDNTNILGLGGYRLADTGATTLDYTAITSVGFTGDDALTQTLEFSINGGAKEAITIAADGASDQTEAIATLNSLFAANTTLNAAGLRAVADGGQIRIESTNGTAFRLNAVNEAVAGTLGFGGNGDATAVAATANFSSALRAGAAGAINFGAGSTLEITANGTAYTVDLNGDGSLADVVSSINGTSGLSGLVDAGAFDGRLVLAGDNANTKIQITGASSDSVLTTLGLTRGDSNIPDKNTFNSGGAYNTALGSDNDVFSYTQFRNGSDSQTLNIVALDSAGTQRSLSVTLRNDSIARNARSLDEAISTINTALQNSADPTLKQIVAVKETSANGREDGIRFVSALKDFRVTVGSVAGSTAASEIGIFDATTGTAALGQGTIVAAEQAEGGSQLDISSQANAQNAVSALATAVSKLGDAQAVVGRGQNQFNFAINLASSQVTNIAASESRIRDADLAAEAANLTTAQIKLQAGVAATAQANSSIQVVLTLLQG